MTGEGNIQLKRDKEMCCLSHSHVGIIGILETHHFNFRRLEARDKNLMNGIKRPQNGLQTDNNALIYRSNHPPKHITNI